MTLGLTAGMASKMSSPKLQILARTMYSSSQLPSAKSLIMVKIIYFPHKHGSPNGNINTVAMSPHSVVEG